VKFSPFWLKTPNHAVTMKAKKPVNTTASRDSFGVAADLFPGRVATPITVTTGAAHNGSAGSVQFAPDGSAVVDIPPALTAYGRMVRMHEADHVMLTPSRVTKTGKVKLPAWLPKDIHPALVPHVANAAEDMRISLIPNWEKRGRLASRDAVTAALRDLRGTIRAQRRIASMTPEQLNAIGEAGLAARQNVGVVSCCRAMALLSATGGSSRFASAVVRTAFMALGVSEYGDAGFGRCLKLARDAAKRPAIMVNLAACIAGMMTIPPTPKAPGSEESTGGTRTGNEQPTEDPGDPDFATGNIPQLVHAPLTRPCDGIGTKRRSAASGSAVNRRVLATALVNPSARPFVRRERAQYRGHGSYMFDASGSMGVSAERLIEVASACPGATMAYYSGDGGKGQIVVFAQGGRRMAGMPEHLKPAEGNWCDLEAVRWLLKQRGPRFLVSDLGFCGESSQATSAAFALLRRATASGQLAVIPSYRVLARELGLDKGKSE
jgi:hypothetical protein